jgi:hypothetical protein
VPVPVTAAALLGWRLLCHYLPLPLLLLVWRRRQPLPLLLLPLLTDAVAVLLLLLSHLLLLLLLRFWFFVWWQRWLVLFLQIHVSLTIITSSSSTTTLAGSIPESQTGTQHKQEHRRADCKHSSKLVGKPHPKSTLVTDVLRANRLESALQ